jgi:hypothetical protein
MGPNGCSWRTFRVLTATAILLFVGVGNIHAQHTEARTNRVWSLRISFITCGATLDSVRIAQVKPNGEIGPWQRANPELLIIQWSQNLPYDLENTCLTKYTLLDLLVDFGQTRYILELTGWGSTEGVRFSDTLWVSPAGISKTPIPLAPVRENRELAWSDDEHEEFSAWYFSHEWRHKKFFREFAFLLSRSDRKLDFPIRIQSNLETCEPAETEGER